MFVPTKASKEVRKMITFKRLVIVAGKIKMSFLQFAAMVIRIFPKRKVTKFLKANQFVLHPIHIASVFHNYELLKEFLKKTRWKC